MPPKRRVAAPPPGVVKKDPRRKEDKWAPMYDPVKHTRGFGGMPAPRHDVRRWVKWPRYVRIQRQRASLWMRLRVPPAINQFTYTLERNQAYALFRLLLKYRPEDKKAKQARLQKEAEEAAKEKEVDKKKPLVVKFGLNHVTSLIESKKAQLVVIAHDVHPIEMVVWLPALCKKMDVPYCIVKDKARCLHFLNRGRVNLVYRLGTVVHQKTAAVLAITGVRNEDQKELVRLAELCSSNYNEGQRVAWGGGVLGPKAQAKLKRKELALAKEISRRMDT